LGKGTGVGGKERRCGKGGVDKKEEGREKERELYIYTVYVCISFLLLFCSFFFRIFVLSVYRHVK